MTIVRRLAVFMVCLAAFAPRFAPALELGPIEARSGLYELLDARISIRDVRSGELEGLKVTLGSPAQFELAQVPRLQSLDLLEFVVVEGDDGDDYIHVRTDEPIIEPLLAFLIDVDWPRGRVVRGYKLSLSPVADPAAAVSRIERNAPRAQPLPRTQPLARTQPLPRTQSQPETGTSRTVRAAPPVSGGTDYGPVRESETLWSIAFRLRPDTSVSVQRMMLAILEANPEAFSARNVNALNAGSTLRIPGRDEIGPDDRQAAIAEVNRQNSVWPESRREARAAPTPAAPSAGASTGDTGTSAASSAAASTGGTGTSAAPSAAASAGDTGTSATPSAGASTGGTETPAALSAAASTDDSGSEPGGRIEVVSAETGADVSGQEEGAEFEALRKELALALEEVDAGRRENDEFKLRLVDAENQIRELTRLVMLKNEEIAVLQAGLGSLSETTPAQVPAPAEEKSESAAGSAETAQVPAPAEEESEPVAGSAETAQVPVLAEEESESVAGSAETAQVPALAEEESESVAGSAETVQVPAEEESEPVAGSAETTSMPVPAPSEMEPDSAMGAEPLPLPLPFGLGTLPVDPVFLVGGAGLLLLLLGVLALLRRRRARADEEDVFEFADVPAPDEDQFLHELEVVAADLADGRTDERERLAESDRNDNVREVIIDLDALVADDSESGTEGGRTSGGHDSGRFDDPTVRREAESKAVNPHRPAGEAGASLDPFVSYREARTSDLGIVESAPSIDAGRPPGHDSGIPDDGRYGGYRYEGAGRRGGFESVPNDDSGGPGSMPPASLDEPAGAGDTDAFSVEGFGEDEVQTKIDLAQVYMEMGDAERARGYLEAVLTRGSAEQRNTIRKMLSKLV